MIVCVCLYSDIRHTHIRATVVPLTTDPYLTGGLGDNVDHISRLKPTFFKTERINKKIREKSRRI